MPKAKPPKGATAVAQGDVKALIQALAGDGWKVRSDAADALGELGDPQAVEGLIEALGDPENVVKRSAAAALGRLRDPRAAQPLTWLLWQGHNDSYVTGPVVDALVNIGSEAVEGIENCIRENVSFNLRVPAAAVLGRIGGERAVRFLIELLSEKPQPGNEHYANWNTRAAVVTALGEIGDPTATDAVISVLLRKSPSDFLKTQYAAAHALDKLGWEPGVDRVSAFYWAAKFKWEKCVELGSLAFEPVVLLLDEAGQDLKIDAAVCLGQLGDRRAIKPLVKLRKTAGAFGGGEDIDEALRKLGWKG